MNVITALYRRLDLIQRTRWFRIAATVIALAAVAAIFIPIVRTTSVLETRRAALVGALTGASLADQDEVAMSLQARGTVTVDGRTYGGNEAIERIRGQIFDAQGRVFAPEALAEVLLLDQRPGWAPNWLVEQPSTTTMLGVVLAAWLLLVIWSGLVVELLLTLVLAGVPVGVSYAVGSVDGMWLFAGFGLLTFTYILLTRVVMLLIDRPIQPLAVAHTVLKECSRTRIALLFIIALLFLLPLIPMTLDVDQPLRYRMQTFISRSLGLTFVVAACFTLVVGCSSITFEFRDRQIWQLVTKPVSRLSYLLGKWIGVMTANAIILLVAGVSIFTYIQYLRTQPVAPGLEGQVDAVQVRDAVLTARSAREPDYRQLEPESVRDQVEQRIERDPELAAMETVPLYQKRKIAEEIVNEHNLAQRSIPPQTARQYVFTGLGPARDSGTAIMLQYRFNMLDNNPNRTFDVVFQFNEDQSTSAERKYIPTMTHTLLIGPDMIAPDGSMSVEVLNPYVPEENSRYGAINFDRQDFMMLYKVADFEGNFVRAVMIQWAKLSFLAMIAVLFSTFLSFPVACLASFTVLVGGLITPFLSVSLQEFYPPPAAAMDWGNAGMVIEYVVKTVIRSISQVMIFALDGFGRLDPSSRLVEGRLIAWGEVATALLRLTLVWSGIALLVSWWIMRTRELATYSGS